MRGSFGPSKGADKGHASLPPAAVQGGSRIPRAGAEGDGADLEGGGPPAEHHGAALGVAARVGTQHRDKAAGPHARLVRLGSVYIAAIAHPDHEYAHGFILNVANNPVVANAVTPQATQWAGQ